VVDNLGLRYRLHRKDLPGKPDVVFSKKKTAVFVRAQQDGSTGIRFRSVAGSAVGRLANRPPILWARVRGGLRLRLARPTKLMQATVLHSWPTGSMADVDDFHEIVSHSVEDF
jgi:hypothetical protein